MFRISRCILIVFAMAVASQAAPLQFRFHPPDSLSFSEVVITDHTRWDDTTALPTDSSIAVVAHTLKRVNGGYRMTTHPTSIVTKRGAKETGNPVNELLTLIQSEARLDTLGVISSVTGFERLPEHIDSLYKGELAARLKQSLSPENMAAREKLQWNGVMEKLSGSTVNLDTITYEQSEYPLPGSGHLPLLIVIRFTDTLTIEGKLCAVLLISAGSDIGELAARTHVPIDDLVVHYPMADTLGIAISKAGSRYIADTRAVLEISTLLPQSQRTVRDVTVVGSTSAGAKTIRLVQSENRQYEYQD